MEREREQLCIAVRYISEINGVFRVHEDPIYLIDAVKSIVGSLLLAGMGTGKVVRFTGQNFDTIVRNKWHTLNLDPSKGDWPRVGLGMKYEQRNQGSSNFNTERRACSHLFSLHDALFQHVSEF